MANVVRARLKRESEEENQNAQMGGENPFMTAMQMSFSTVACAAVFVCACMRGGVPAITGTGLKAPRHARIRRSIQSHLTLAHGVPHFACSDWFGYSVMQCAYESNFDYCLRNPFFHFANNTQKYMPCTRALPRSCRPETRGATGAARAPKTTGGGQQRENDHAVAAGVW